MTHPTIPSELLEALKSKRYAECLDGLQALAEEGDVVAATGVAHIYLYGGGGVKQDYNKAREWLQILDSSNVQLPFVSYRLGVIYYKGLGIKRDRRRAFRLFRRAALQGDAQGRLIVGAMLREGDGVQVKRWSSRVLLIDAVRNPRLSPLQRVLAAYWLSLSWLAGLITGVTTRRSKGGGDN